MRESSLACERTGLVIALRLIHWRSSARLGELMVKQFQRTETREFVILLDLPPRATQSKMESAINLPHLMIHMMISDEDIAVEFVASIAQHVCASNHAVLTVAIADHKRH
jgi:uncharacterized protein (DUF58 family)